MTRVAPAPAAREWVLHGLALLPVRDHPASLWDPRYVAHARATVPPACDALLREDADALALRFSAANAVELHALPAAFESMSALVAVAKDPLDRSIVGVDHRAIERCLARDRDLTEWLLLDLAYGATEYEAHHRAHVEPALREACDRALPALAIARTVDPSLDRSTIELSSALGLRGRAFASDWFMVGATGLWCPHDESRLAVQALHERAVTSAPFHDYLRAEWHALVALAHDVASSPLASAHAAWLDSMELGSLVSAAIERGLIADERLGRALRDREIPLADGLRRCARPIAQ